MQPIKLDTGHSSRDRGTALNSNHVTARSNNQTRVKGKVTIPQTMHGLVLISSSQSDIRQMTLVTKPAVGCHYFLQGLWSPFQLQSITALG